MYSALFISVALVIEFAQLSGPSVQPGSIEWDLGFPKGDELGNIFARGTYSLKPGWSLKGPGELSAYDPVEAEESCTIAYEARVFFKDNVWQAIALTEIPSGRYHVILQFEVTKDGETEWIWDRREVVVGGAAFDKKRERAGRLDLGPFH